MCVGACGGQKRALGLLELELEEAGRVRVGTSPSSSRVASLLSTESALQPPGRDFNSDADLVSKP